MKFAKWMLAPLVFLAALATGWAEFRNGTLWIRVSSRRVFMDGAVEKSYEAEWIDVARPGRRFFKMLSGDSAPFV